MSNIFAGLEDLGFKNVEKVGSGKTGCQKRNKRRRPAF